MFISDLKQTTKSRRCRQYAVVPWLILIVSILLQGGCSSTQWLYRNADWVVERYAVKSLDVNEAQLEAWRPVLEKILEQHLSSEIPILAHYLDLMARAVNESPGERVDATCLVNGATLIFTRHAKLAADLASPLMAQIESRQIDHLADYFAERDSRFRERYLQGNERDKLQARVERITRRIQKWTGKLSSDQQARIERFTLKLPDVAANWFSHRKRQEEILLQLLRNNADADSLHSHLLNWWIPWAGSSPEFTVQWRQVETAFIHLIDDLAISLSERQKQHFRGEIASLTKDLAGLLTGTSHIADENSRTSRCDSLGA